MKARHVKSDVIYSVLTELIWSLEAEGLCQSFQHLTSEPTQPTNTPCGWNKRALAAYSPPHKIFFTLLSNINYPTICAFNNSQHRFDLFALHYSTFSVFLLSPFTFYFFLCLIIHLPQFFLSRYINILSSWSLIPSLFLSYGF